MIDEDRIVKPHSQVVPDAVIIIIPGYCGCRNIMDPENAGTTFKF